MVPSLDFFVLFSKLCQELNSTHVSTPLPEVRLTSKDPFVVKPFAVRTLPRVTLGKIFVESKMAFVECTGHSTNHRFPVVPVYLAMTIN